MHQAQSLWHISSAETVLQKEILGELAEGEVIVKSLFSLISTGTERLIARGMVPSELYESMSVPYMGGSFGFPVKYGYSMVGEVATKGHPMTGHLVHIMHPHQDFCKVKANDLFLIPESVSPQRASLASNLETAVNAVWDANVSIGDRVVVVGFGMIGSLLARLLSMMPGVSVFIVEKDKKRLESAKRMGFETYMEQGFHGKLDLAFHTSGSSEGLQACIDAVGKEGIVIDLSWYGTKKVDLQLGTGFHVDRKQIISSQVSNIPAAKTARWDFKRRKELVFELLKNPLFDQHISHVIGLEEAPALFENLRQHLSEGLGYLISYNRD